MLFSAITQADMVSAAQQRLRALRQALEDAQDYYKWISAYSASDLAAAFPTLSSADAQALLNAAADANSIAVLYNGGTFGGTLPYDFSASQRTVTGP